MAGKGARKRGGGRCLTFHLFHHVVEVVLQLGVGGDEQGKPVLLDAGEGLGGVDAPLVQNTVDAIGCAHKAGRRV